MFVFISVTHNIKTDLQVVKSLRTITDGTTVVIGGNVSPADVLSSQVHLYDVKAQEGINYNFGAKPLADMQQIHLAGETRSSRVLHVRISLRVI